MRRFDTHRLLLACVLTLAAAPAAADYRQAKTLDLAPGGRFVLSSSIGDALVIGDSSAGAQITITSTLDRLEDKFDVRFENSPGIAKLTIERRGGWLGGFFDGGWFNGQSARIEVHVPRQTTVDVTTSGGDIEIGKLDGGVSASSSGGTLEVHEVRGDVRAESSGGGVRITAIDGAATAGSSGGGVEIEAVSGEVRAESSGGGVRVRAAGGRVEASSSGGPVKVAFASGNDRGGELESSGGGVQVEVDPAVGLSIDASSSGGSVDCDLPVTVQGRLHRDEIHGNLNGGGALLRVSSSGGGVHLTAGR